MYNLRLFITILFILILVGCSQKPEVVVKSFLDDFKEFELSEISTFEKQDIFFSGISFSESVLNLEKFVSIEQKEIFASLIKEIDYKILETEVLDESAIVKIKITNKDISKIIQNSIIQTVQHVLANYPGEIISDADLDNIYLDIFIAETSQVEEKTEQELEIYLVKEDDKWKIDRENNLLFFNTLMGNLITMEKPTFMANLSKVEAGDRISFVISNNNLWGWGLNDYGQLGDGTKIPKSYPVHILEDVVDVTSGERFTVALKSDASLWAWGWNWMGELGNGNQKESLIPIKVMEEVKDFSVGYSNVFVIKNDDSLWAWGRKIDGIMLDGNLGDNAQLTPIHIMDDVKDVSQGLRHVVVLKNNGSLWTWGVNWMGQLCNGATTESYSQNNIANNVKSIFAGYNHSTFYISKDNSLWACGHNSLGQLGDGTTTNKFSPVKISNDFKTIDPGSLNSLGIKSDESLWFWGLDDYSQVLNVDNRLYGTTTKPKKIMDNVIEISSNIHNLIIRSDGTLWSWGKNDFAQLGTGTTKDSLIPINISKYYNEVSKMITDRYFILSK